MKSTPKPGEWWIEGCSTFLSDKVTIIDVTDTQVIVETATGLRMINREAFEDSFVQIPPSVRTYQRNRALLITGAIIAIVLLSILSYLCAKHYEGGATPQKVEQ